MLLPQGALAHQLAQFFWVLDRVQNLLRRHSLRGVLEGRVIAVTPQIIKTAHLRRDSLFQFRAGF